MWLDKHQTLRIMYTALTSSNARQVSLPFVFVTYLQWMSVAQGRVTGVPEKAQALLFQTG